MVAEARLRRLLTPRCSINSTFLELSLWKFRLPAWARTARALLLVGLALQLGILYSYFHEVPSTYYEDITASAGWMVVPVLVAISLGWLRGLVVAVAGTGYVAFAFGWDSATLLSAPVWWVMVALAGVMSEIHKNDKEQLATIIDSAEESIVTYKLDGTVITFNPAAERLYGYRPQEIIGRNWKTLIPEDDHWQLKDMFKAAKEGRPYRAILRRETKHGQLLMVEGTAAPINDQHGNPVAVCSIVRDVTSRAEAEQQLREAMERLLSAEHEQRKHVAEALHDDTVQVMTGALLKLDTARGALIRAGVDFDTAETLREATDSLRRAVHRTRRMMFELRPTTLDTSGLKPTLAHLVASLRNESGIVVTYSCPEQRFDPAVEQLAYRVILESLQNVRKHSRAQTANVHVHCDQEYLTIEVRDNGVGFDTSTLRKGSHLHIGVDSCVERLKLAGGHYNIHSRPLQGTVVAFDIPLKPTPQAVEFHVSTV